LKKFRLKEFKSAISGKTFIILLVLLLLLNQCIKLPKKNQNKNLNNSYNNEMNIKKNSEIDMEKMKSIVADSNSMNIEVFAAMSVLHKNYSKQFEKDTVNLNEEEQKKFFEQKKNDFFKTMKFSEAEYNAFLEHNLDKINEYISEHKEISEFLMSIN
jgi:hypothetical protein